MSDKSYECDNYKCINWSREKRDCVCDSIIINNKGECNNFRYR